MKDVKQILITGKNSYIGESLEKWLKKSDGKYNIDTVDMKRDLWKKTNFSLYDTILHVAGIAHIKETDDNRDLYYKVNRDLAYDTAVKAKRDGVKQFIFLSSMSIYGQDTGAISIDTVPNPKTAYGKSKYEAESMIKKMEDDSFKVVILRPPMVYGPNSRGNYQLLSKFAKKIPIFPKVDNIRSMIFIDNLSEFIKTLIDRGENGIFFPQNKDYVNTSNMVKEIANVNKRKMILLKTMNPLVRISMGIPIVKKVFGSLYYDESTFKSRNINYISFKDTIHFTEEDNVS